MVGIIQLFGILSIVVAVLLILFSLLTIVFLPVLLPVGASVLLGGALLLAFARVVELLESINEKLGPGLTIERTIRPHNNVPDHAEAQGSDQGVDAEGSFGAAELPKGTAIYDARELRVAVLPDSSVLVYDPVKPKWFSSTEEYRRQTHDDSEWRFVEER